MAPSRNGFGNVLMFLFQYEIRRENNVFEQETECEYLATLRMKTILLGSPLTSLSSQKSSLFPVFKICFLAIYNLWPDRDLAKSVSITL